MTSLICFFRKPDAITLVHHCNYINSNLLCNELSIFSLKSLAISMADSFYYWYGPSGQPKNLWLQNNIWPLCTKNMHRVNLVFFSKRCRVSSWFLPPSPAESERPVVFENGRGSVSEELVFLKTIIDQQQAEGSQGSTNSKPSHRRKRFLSYPRYVELMVTADAKMTRHHGRNLEHYILTIMSVVSKILFLKLFIYLILIINSLFYLFFGFFTTCSQQF